MKSKRQNKILEIISNGRIDTQDALIAALCASGFEVTQATVSRDIRELRLIKAPDGYIAPADTAVQASILSQSVLSVDSAGFIVSIKCRQGMAGAACAYIDAADWPVPIVGTLAGDDTIFLLLRTEQDAARFQEQFRQIANL